MRIFCGLVFASTFVALASPYGYKYFRNPRSGQCQLQLSVPGGGWTGQQYYYVYPGTNYGYYTYGKYGSSLGTVGAATGTGTKYFGAAAEYNPQETGIFQGSNSPASYDKNTNSGEKYEGSGGGGYGSSSGSYGGASHSNSYEGSVGNKHGSSNYGGSYESSSGAHGGNSGGSYGGSSGAHGGNGGSYGVSSGSNYQPSSNNAGGNYGSSNNEPTDYEGGGHNYGNSNKHGSSSSSSYGSPSNGGSYEDNDRDSDRKYGSSSGSSANSGSNYGGTRDRDRDRDRNTAGNNSPSSSSTYNNNRNIGSKYGGSSDRDRDRETDNYGSSGYDREDEDGYFQKSRPPSSSSGSSASSSTKYGSSNSPSGNRGSSGSSYNRESSSSGNGGGGSSSSYGSGSSAENYGGGDRNWNKQQATVTSTADNGEYLKKEFAGEVLKTHNSYRARHTTPPVTLDEQMSIKAQEWAYDLASARVPYGRSPEAVEGTYGESLEIVNDPFTTGREVVTKWYDEKYNYNFGKPELVKKPESKSNSHFTAIVWKSTRKIGVGTATSSDGRTFVVVNYFPAGNIVDVLEDNVLPPRGSGE